MDVARDSEKQPWTHASVMVLGPAFLKNLSRACELAWWNARGGGRL